MSSRPSHLAVITTATTVLLIEPNYLAQVLNMKVDDEAEVQKMLEAMKSAASVTDNNPISMSFAGTKRFGSGSVVYAAVTEGLDAVRALYASLQARTHTSVSAFHMSRT